MEKLCFCPMPNRVTDTGERMTVPAIWRVLLPEKLYGLKPALASLWPGLEFASCEHTPAVWKKVDIRFCEKPHLASEAYEISVERTEVNVAFSDKAGAFYAMTTLYQMVCQSKAEIPCCQIEDAPGLRMRGVLLDISRGKVLKLETLKSLADLFASVKINHLELYMEGFSYGYPSFPQVWEKNSCLTEEEIKELSTYCSQRFIELVPHQNSLGHMAPWLAREEFRHLAEAPEGLEVMGMKFPPTTMDASDPGTIALMKQMIDDVSVGFDSRYFHVGLDEAFEFCKGKNQEKAKARGAWNVILPYIQALYEYLGEKGFQMIMWDDFLVNYPELLDKLPEDIMIFDWGYDREFPVEKRAEFLQKAGKTFCLCPGTSSWSSFTGLTDNMLENIRRTAAAAHAYHAHGIMVTDWGDKNHLQYQPVSYAGFLYGAAWAWNAEGISEKNLARALNCFVFQDSTETIGEFCLRTGRFYHLEEFRMPCSSLACLPLILKTFPKEGYQASVERLVKAVRFFSPEEVCEAYLASYEERKAFDGPGMYGFLAEQQEMLEKVSLACADGVLIVREYTNALNMLLYLTKIREQIETGNTEEDLNGLLDEILKEHVLLWRARNKESGLKAGLDMFEKLRGKKV